MGKKDTLPTFLSNVLCYGFFLQSVICVGIIRAFLQG